MLRFRVGKRQGAAVLLGAGAVLLACGPNFPNRLLLMGDAAVMSAPRAEFRREIERVLPTAPPRFKAIEPASGTDVYRQSIEVDVSDLRMAMGDAAAVGVIDRYAAVRKAARGSAAVGEIPVEVPVEFGLYLRGVIEFHDGHLEEARAVWNEVLRLPEAQRRWRSVWASYMMGTSYLEREPVVAAGWFQGTRALAGEGFSDNLGLAAASLGWEARAELDSGNIGGAMRLYLEQAATGDSSALLSLRHVSAGVIQQEKIDLDALVKDVPTRWVLLAYLVSIHGNGAPGIEGDRSAFVSSFLGALEKSGSLDLASADRLAWAAYQAGDFATAERWLKLAPDGAPVAMWLRAKLLLRAGKLDEAAAMLARASKAFPANEEWSTLSSRYEQMEVNPSLRCVAEAGVIYLARRQYTEALDCMMRAGLWVDAAFVAERVLTLEELKAYVDRAGPLKPAAAVVEGEAANSEMLRHLLARKLARLERFDEAAKYMPAAHAESLAKLAANLREGSDQRRSRAERAASLWMAAKVMRAEGLDLVGTELGPDAVIYGGQYETASLEEEKEMRSEGPLLKASSDELARIGRSGVVPDARWHYRFVAAQLGWDAAVLMPDEDAETAKVLWTAGSWLKNQDREAADRFYKALVRRCGKTDLGKRAEELRWFPAGE